MSISFVFSLHDRTVVINLFASFSALFLYFQVHITDSTKEKTKL